MKFNVCSETFCSFTVDCCRFSGFKILGHVKFQAIYKYYVHDIAYRMNIAMDGQKCINTSEQMNNSNENVLVEYSKQFDK